MAVGTAMTSCGGADDRQYPPAEITEVHSLLREFGRMDSSERAASIHRDSIVLASFLAAVGDSAPSIESVERRSAAPATTVFTPLVDSVFPEPSLLSYDIGAILGRAGELGLSLPQRRYATVVYGRPQSILFVDSTMLIALNHYLGADFDGYSHLPAYIRATKHADMLPLDIAEALTATAYPYEAPAQSPALARLLYEGALAHAKMALTGTSGNPAPALGYTDSQLEWLMANEHALWKALVEKNLLYDTAESTAGRLVDPAPATSLLSPDCPGRAGRFIGWRIVESYLRRHPGTALETMLQAPFYTSATVLRDSGYN